MARKMWYAALIWLVASGLLGSVSVAATDDGDAAGATARRGVPADMPVYRPPGCPNASAPLCWPFTLSNVILWQFGCRSARIWLRME